MPSSPDLATIVRGHQATVWKYLRVLGCDSHEADELTQATFVEVLRKGFEYRSEAETAAYLRSKARFLYLTLRRNQRRAPNEHDIENAETVFDTYERDDMGGTYIEALEDCLETLDERSRDVIDLQYRKSYTFNEISDALDMTESNAKAIAHRSRASLRECIERRLG